MFSIKFNKDNARFFVRDIPNGFKKVSLDTLYLVISIFLYKFVTNISGITTYLSTLPKIFQIGFVHTFIYLLIAVIIGKFFDVKLFGEKVL